MDRYLITGATGLIGSAIAKHLLKDGCYIICPVRCMAKAHEIFINEDYNSIELIESELIPFLKHLSGEFDYIIHCASPTASKYFTTNPVETLRFGIDSTELILDYCKIHSIKGMIYISSLESYGTVLDDSTPIKEDFQGYVNPLSSRSSYNMVKRTCESLCYSYFSEYKVPVKIARLTQTVSPDIEPTDMRIFAQFARCAAEGKDVVMYSDGMASRQYVYVDDVVDAIMRILKYGNPGESYNVANEDTYISAKDLAILVQSQFNPNGKVIFRPDETKGYPPTTKIKLDSSKLKELGWSPSLGLKEMLSLIIKNIQKSINKS